MAQNVAEWHNVSPPRYHANFLITQTVIPSRCDVFVTTAKPNEPLGRAGRCIHSSVPGRVQRAAAEPAVPRGTLTRFLTAGTPYTDAALRQELKRRFERDFRWRWVCKSSRQFVKGSVPCGPWSSIILLENANGPLEEWTVLISA